MSLVSELVRGEVRVEERADVERFCIFSGTVEAEVAEITEAEPETLVFPLFFLLNFVGLMKSVIG